MTSPKEPSAVGSTYMLGTGDIQIEPSAVPDAAEATLTGRVLDGRYIVGDRLGAGGVGAVYAAEHVEIKKAVALKVLRAPLGQSESIRLRFEREARAASRLSHPACVSVIDFGRVARVEPAEGAARFLGMPYLVMERVRGDVLSDRLAEGPLPPRTAIDIVRRVLSALRHAHELGLVHRDVKPANIMVSPRNAAEPWAKLLDFGLVKGLDPGEEDGRQLTEAGMVFGTPSYLSPEQARGEQAEPRSDLYSLGVVLFELCCGRVPFAHESRLEVVRDHIVTPPLSPRSLAPALSPELDAVIVRALAKNAAERFANAEGFSSALARVPEAQDAPRVAPGEPAIPTSALERLAAQRSFRVAAAVALCIGVTLVGLALARHHPAPISPSVLLAAAPYTRSHHLKLAIDYRKKLWCSDALDELDRAAAEDARVGEDPEAIGVAVGCLRQKTQARAVHFLTDTAGRAALPALADVEADDPRADYRAGAARARADILGHK